MSYEADEIAKAIKHCAVAMERGADALEALQQKLAPTERCKKCYATGQDCETCNGRGWVLKTWRDHESGVDPYKEPAPL